MTHKGFAQFLDVIKRELTAFIQKGSVFVQTYCESKKTQAKAEGTADSKV